MKIYIINSLTKSSQNFDNLCQFQIWIVLMRKLDIKNLEKINKKLGYGSRLWTNIWLKLTILSNFVIFSRVKFGKFRSLSEWLDYTFLAIIFFNSSSQILLFTEMKTLSSSWNKFFNSANFLHQLNLSYWKLIFCSDELKYHLKHHELQKFSLQRMDH